MVQNSQHKSFNQTSVALQVLYENEIPDGWRALKTLETLWLMLCVHGETTGALHLQPPIPAESLRGPSIAQHNDAE